METNNNDNLFDLEFDQIIKSHMESIAKWGRIIAYVAFASYAVNIVVIIFGKNVAGSMAGGLAGAIFTAILGGILNYFLLKFSNHTLMAIANNSELDMEKAAENLNYYNKMTGILLIIVFSFMVLAFVFAGLFSR